MNVEGRTTTKARPARRVAEAPPPGQMRAIVMAGYGSADVLHLETLATPTIGDAEVLVRVRAAGLDRGTWHVMTGKPYLIRLMGFGLRRPKEPVPGLDLSGTVVAVGSAVTRFKVGDAVFGVGRGTFAEYAAAREDKLAEKPAGLSFEQAAVMGVSGLTALHALRDAGRVEAGQRVLVLGASGGVGSYAVQLARAFGAEVTGVCSTAKMDFVRALGAGRAIDYTRGDFTELPERYDLILDIAGNTPLLRLRRVLAPKGTVVFVGGEHGGVLTGGFFGRPLLGMLIGPFVGQRFPMLMSKEHHADLEVLAQLVEAGRLVPYVGEVHPLDEAAEAMRHLEAGRVRGKVAIQVAGPRIA